MSAARCDSLADEMAGEREARLQQTSALQCDRPDSDTAEEREGRLQQMSGNQCVQVASETTEREIWLSHYSGYHCLNST